MAYRFAYSGLLNPYYHCGNFYLPEPTEVIMMLILTYVLKISWDFSEAFSNYFVETSIRPHETLYINCKYYAHTSILFQRLLISTNHSHTQSGALSRSCEPIYYKNLMITILYKDKTIHTSDVDENVEISVEFILK